MADSLHENLELIIPQLRDVFFSCARISLRSHLSPTGKSLTGCSIEETLGVGILDFVHPGSLQENPS